MILFSFCWWLNELGSWIT